MLAERPYLSHCESTTQQKQQQLNNNNNNNNNNTNLELKSLNSWSARAL